MKRLKKIGGSLAALACITFLNSCLASNNLGLASVENETAPAAEIGDAALTDIEEELLALINDERQENGLPVLVRDPGLDEIMLWYGTDMVLGHHIGHIDINGRRAQERVNYYSGRTDVRCSEITAWWGNGTAEDHYNAYFNSAGHHAAYMEEGIFNLGPTTHVGVVVLAGTGPAGSAYEGRAGTYSGLVFCDDSVEVVIDPFGE